MKDREEFKPGGGICYEQEHTYIDIDDNGNWVDVGYYTYYDFLSIAEGNVQYAEKLFDLVEWESPYTLHEENMEQYGSIENCLKGIEI